MTSLLKGASVVLAAGTMLAGGMALAVQRPQTASLLGSGSASGYWQGYNTASQLPGRRIPTAFVFNQSGNRVSGGYVTASGVYGTGTGSFNASIGSVTWTNTSPQCPGTYTNSYQVTGNTIRWTYSGHDCLGAETGSGSATRVPISPPPRRRRR
jgi:hypothetical protein